MKRQSSEPSLTGQPGKLARNCTGLGGDTQTELRGYRFDGARLDSFTELPALESRALESGSRLSSPSKNGDRQPTVAIPIKLRGLAIGVIGAQLKEDYSEETISTIELASERLASALESARLYEEARLRADREQSIAQITSAISASTSYEEIPDHHP